MNVDVDTIVDFIDTKSSEIEALQASHEDELFTFLKDAGLDAQTEFTGDDVDAVDVDTLISFLETKGLELEALQASQEEEL